MNAITRLYERKPASDDYTVLRKGGDGMEQEINIYDEETLDALKMALANGKIDIDALKHDAYMKKRENSLSKHQHKIWEGADGNWYTFVPDDTKPKNRRKVKRKDRDSMIEFLVRFYSGEGDKGYVNANITFAEVFLKWQKYSEEMHLVRPSTIDRRECDYQRFIEGELINSMPMCLINEGHILMFLDKLIQEHMGKIGAKAFNNTKSIISGTFQYAKIYLRVDCMLVKELLATYKAPINAFKKVNQHNQVFMDDEVDLMVKKIRKDYWYNPRYVAILFMLTTGLRLGEMVALKTTDFLPGNKLYVHRSLTKEKLPNGKHHRIISETAKTDSSIDTIYLSGEAVAVYEQLMKIRLMSGEASDWLCSENGDYISDCKIDKALRSLCRELNIPVRGCHKLRKTYCSYLLELDVGEKIVQKQMRHACIQTTQNHYYYSTKVENKVREEINKSSRVAVAIGS